MQIPYTSLYSVIPSYTHFPWFWWRIRFSCWFLIGIKSDHRHLSSQEEEEGAGEEKKKKDERGMLFRQESAFMYKFSSSSLVTKLLSLLSKTSWFQWIFFFPPWLLLMQTHASLLVLDDDAWCLLPHSFSPFDIFLSIRSNDVLFFALLFLHHFSYDLRDHTSLWS